MKQHFNNRIKPNKGRRQWSISAIIVFGSFLFTFQLTCYSQKCDTIQISGGRSRQIDIFPYHQYKVSFDQKSMFDSLWIKSDSNAVISKDSLGNVFVYFKASTYFSGSSKISYGEISNENEDSISKIFNFKPAQTYLYFMDNDGKCLFTGDTIGDRELGNAKLFAGTIFSNIDKSFDVVSFSVEFRKNNKLKEQKVIGPYINKKLLKDIYRLPKGKPILIKDIWIEFQEGYNIYIDPLIFYR